MKKVFLSLMAVATIFALNSCKPKISDQMKTDITTFKTDWAKMATDLAAWGDGMTASAKKMADADKDLHVGMDTAKMKTKEEKAKAAEHMGRCKANAEKVTAMQKSYGDFKKGIDDATTAFNDWSAKVDKGEVTEADAKTAMETYHKQLDDAKAKMTEWDGSLKAVVADEDKNEADCNKLMAEAKGKDKAKDVKPAPASGK